MSAVRGGGCDRPHALNGKVLCVSLCYVSGHCSWSPSYLPESSLLPTRDACSSGWGNAQPPRVLCSLQSVGSTAFCEPTVVRCFLLWLPQVEPGRLPAAAPVPRSGGGTRIPGRTDLSDPMSRGAEKTQAYSWAHRQVTMWEHVNDPNTRSQCTYVHCGYSRV